MSRITQSRQKTNYASPQRTDQNQKTYKQLPACNIKSRSLPETGQYNRKNMPTIYTNVRQETPSTKINSKETKVNGLVAIFLENKPGRHQCTHYNLKNQQFCRKGIGHMCTAISLFSSFILKIRFSFLLFGVQISVYLVSLIRRLD